MPSVNTGGHDIARPSGDAAEEENVTTSSTRTTDSPDTDINGSIASSATIYSVLNAANRNVGGGKLGKSRRGWNNVSASIVHRILDFALLDVHLPPSVAESWETFPETLMIGTEVTRRIWMCNMRLLSTSWRAAVDSHTFWPLYTLIIDPARHHSSSVMDLHSSRTTPSTPSYPTLFKRALRSTSDVCIPCRFNRPHRLGLYPARNHLHQYSPKFGRVPTCEKHIDQICANCLKGREVTRSDPMGRRLVQDSVLEPCAGDYDEDCRRYLAPTALNCHTCRQTALEAHIDGILKRCARGGEVVGDANAIASASSCAQSYVLMGTDYVRNVAHKAIAEAWLTANTAFDDLNGNIRICQHFENELKRQYAASKGAMTEEPEGLAEWRRHHLARLYRAPLDDIDFALSAMNARTEDQLEYWHDDLEGGSLQDDVQEDDADEFWIAQQAEAAMFDVYRNRIRAGCWVSPMDEIAAHIGRLDLPPMPDYIRTAKLPPGIKHRADRDYLPPKDDPSLQYGHIQWRVDRQDGMWFLPSERQLSDLEGWYRRILIRSLRDPIAFMVRDMVRRGWTIESFDEFPPSVTTILEFLRTQRDCWGPFIERRQPDLKPRNRQVKQEAGAAHPQPRPRPERRSSSPVIEVIVDTESEADIAERRFDIRVDPSEGEGDEDVLSSRASDDEIIVAEPLSGDESESPSESSESEEEEELETQEPVINGNGKRPSPPQDETTSATAPVSKRRLSDDYTHTHVHTLTHTTTLPSVLPNGHSLGVEGAGSTTDSRDSSPSGPTEPMPITPEEPEVSDPHPHPHPYDHSADRQAKHARLTFDGAAPPPLPLPTPLLTAYRDIPHIPDPALPLGPYTENVIHEMWQRALKPLRECRCRICDRARRIEEMTVAQIELFAGMR